MMGQFNPLTVFSRLITGAVIVLTISACAPRLQSPGLVSASPAISGDTFITADGSRLALARWSPADGRPIEAILIALHGFNDYRSAFEIPAPILAQAGIMTLAYDQRGFGADDQAGLWAGGDVMAGDLADFVGVVRAVRPGVPLYVLGESMGAAVTIYTMGRQDRAPPAVDGVLLVAPAVWGWDAMNPFYRVALWLTAHVAPGKHVTGSGLDIHPSDNIEMLRAFSRDPLVIKETRVDAVYGLVNLMQAALDSAAGIDVPVTILFGEKDDIVPPRPLELLREKLPPDHVFISYPAGYHMLLRDLCGAAPIGDIVMIIRGQNENPGDGPACQPGHQKSADE